jgi:holo-ACP synthase/triphosphoribosyl-dephospho-CoA synthase
LSAREHRAALRREFAAGNRTLVSLSFNVPDWPKSDPMLREAFGKVLDELVDYLAAHRIDLDRRRFRRQPDAAGDFFLAALRDPGIAAKDVKAVTERFESDHPLGRVLDVDVTAPTGEPVSSGRAKPCLLCPDRPAVCCMREKTHAPGEVRQVLLDRVRAYLEDRRRDALCRGLARKALRATLYEVSHTPKPGLVDRSEASSHADMDYFTFLDSTAALSGSFFDLAAAGYDEAGEDLAALLPRLRRLGLPLERAMFAATGGVNTHKGLIFLMGLALCAAGRVMRERLEFRDARFREIVRGVCAGLVAREMGSPAQGRGGTDGETHGQGVYRKWGQELGGGARAEAEDGFPSVFTAGLPALEAALNSRPTAPGDRDGLHAALDAALFALMAVSRDTNILHRGGPDALLGLRARAAAVRDAVDEATRQTARRDLFEFVAARRLSPGGSGDLLAVTLFVHFVKKACCHGL